MVRKPTAESTGYSSPQSDYPSSSSSPAPKKMLAKFSKLKPSRYKPVGTPASSAVSSRASTPVKQKKPKRKNTFKADPYDADKED
ncbi:hypothetical protein BCON_0017g00080 [Botryotinia convoluta]|uniref:Uncharacterized protein n=1 Tax=Botryotinia convoluta TaxID=54673 RepID=A0A4Z1IMS3_9HELO|nr:hypothetical protein BCON_0017g00080 [Botryotinia convoluta]